MKEPSVYWVSWYQRSHGDYRPISYPPNESILSWWCTGWGEDAATLCAVVNAENDEDVKSKVQQDWPEATDFRFIDKMKNLVLSDRFVPTEVWQIERLDKFKFKFKRY